jgi:hypothetical protein
MSVETARLRLALDIEGQLLSEEQVLGREPRVGVQAGPEKLKEIEHHTADRARHHGKGSYRRNGAQVRAGKLRLFESDAIFTDHTRSSRMHAYTDLPRRPLSISWTFLGRLPVHTSQSSQFRPRSSLAVRRLSCVSVR